MRRVNLFYAVGVVFAAAAGFTSTVLGLACLGFVPLAAGCIWAAYDLTDVGGRGRAKPPTKPQR